MIFGMLIKSNTKAKLSINGERVLISKGYLGGKIWKRDRLL
jgi:hypothetical protein